MDELLLEKIEELRENNSGAFFSQDELRQIFTSYLENQDLSYEMLEALSGIDKRIIKSWQSGDLALTSEGIRILFKACEEITLIKNTRIN